MFTDPESAYLLSEEYAEEQERKALEMAQNATVEEGDEDV
jgi:hypothetical protein